MVYSRKTGGRDYHLGEWIKDIEKDISNLQLKLLDYFRLILLLSNKNVDFLGFLTPKNTLRLNVL